MLQCVLALARQLPHAVPMAAHLLALLVHHLPSICLGVQMAIELERGVHDAGWAYRRCRRHHALTALEVC